MRNSNNVDPEVSVIIPTYNRWPRVVTTINSVLGQTFDDFEIVVVDDASQDHTVQLLTEINDSRIRVLSRSERGGGATARNDGIDAARGKYVAFLDSDDEWLPTKLERQVACARQDDDELTVYFTKLLARFEKKQTVVPRRATYEPGNIGDYFFLNWYDGYVQTSSILLRRSLAERVKFTYGLPIHQDWDFCLRLEQQGARFDLLDEPLVIWNIEARPDRMGMKAVEMREDSLRWVETVKHLISDKAYLSFRAHVPPSSNWRSKVQQSRYLFDALIAGVLGPTDFARTARRILKTK